MKPFLAAGLILLTCSGCQNLRYPPENRSEEPGEYAEKFTKDALADARRRWSSQACLSHNLLVVNQIKGEFDDAWETINLAFSAPDKPGRCLVAQHQRLYGGPSSFEQQSGFRESADISFDCLPPYRIGPARAFEAAVREGVIRPDSSEVTIVLMRMTKKEASLAPGFNMDRLLGRTVWLVRIDHPWLLLVDALSGEPLLKIPGGNWGQARWLKRP